MAAGLCTMSSCPNEATECFCGSGEPDVCEQHARDFDLFVIMGEVARDYVAGFAKAAGASACRRLMDQAWAECEMRLCVIEAERGMVRE